MDLFVEKLNFFIGYERNRKRLALSELFQAVPDSDDCEWSETTGLANQGLILIIMRISQRHACYILI